MRKIQKMSFILFLSAVCLFFLFGNLSSQQTAEEFFEKALYIEEAQGDLQKAIELYEQILKRFPENREIAAKAQLHIGLCYEKLGLQEAPKAFQKVLDDFPEQKEAVKIAKEKLSLIQKMEALAQSGGEDLRMRKVMDGWGKVSPDGRFIAYPNYSTGNVSVYEINSGKRRDIDLGANNKGENPETIGFVGWSHDGKSLVYSWNIDMKHELRTLDLAGGDPYLLYKSDDINYIVPVDWSPDGKSILIAASGKATSGSAAIISVEDKKLDILNLNNEQGYKLEDVVGFSPDGRYLLITLIMDSDPKQKDIYLFSLSQKQIIPLIENPADDVAMGWTADGKYLIYTSDRTGTMDLWVSEFDSDQVIGEPILIKRNIGTIMPMGMSRDGSLFYSLRTGFVDVYVAEVDLNRSESLSEPFSVAEQHIGANTWPTWSPDGEQILYISQRNLKGPGIPGSEVLCIYSLKDKEVREIEPSLDYIRHGIWAPDGKSLLIVGGDNENFHGLHKVDVVTGHTSLVIKYDDDTGIHSPVYTNDGRKIYFRSFKWHHLYSERNYKIRSYDLDTKKEEILFTTKPETAAYLYELALSPDESQISFFTQSIKPICTILYFMPSQGGEPKEILRYNFPDFILKHDWTPDGQHLVLAVGNRKTGETKFYKVSIDNGQTQYLGRRDDFLQSFSLHPDGKHLAFASGKTTWEMWMMENFLPKEK